MSGSTIIKNYKNMENNKFELYRKEVARIDAYFRREWSSEKLHMELLYLQQFCEDFFENKEFPHRVVPF